MMKYTSRSNKGANQRHGALTVMRVFLLAVVLAGLISAKLLVQSVEPATTTEFQQAEPAAQVNTGFYLLLLFGVGLIGVFGMLVVGGMRRASREIAMHNRVEGQGSDYVTIFEAYNQLHRGERPDRPMLVSLYRDGDLNQYPSHLSGQGERETLNVQLPYLIRNKARAERLGIYLEFSASEVQAAQTQFANVTHKHDKPLQELSRHVDPSKMNRLLGRKRRRSDKAENYLRDGRL